MQFGTSPVHRLGRRPTRARAHQRHPRRSRADQAAVARLRRREHSAFLDAPGMEPDDFGVRAWDEIVSQLTPKNLAAIRTSAQQRLPWEADLKLDDLASAPIREQIISDDWQRRGAGPSDRRSGLRRSMRALGWRLNTERLLIGGAAHSAHLRQPDAFNERLRRFLASSPICPDEVAVPE